MSLEAIKYKIGDKVVVRHDLNRNFHENVVDDMEKWAGKTVTISYISNAETIYNLEETGFNWSDHMFEGLAYNVDISAEDLLGILT